MKNKNTYNYKLLLSKKNYTYTLTENTLDKKDLDKGIKVLKSRFITMGKNTLEFEKKFAKNLMLNML